MMIGVGLGITRGGGAFSPLQLPGLKLWLDAGRISGLNDGDPVPTWSDLSGNGNHATQATGSKQPTYKVSIVNGRAVVRLDGVDDFLLCADSASLSPSTLSVFVVVKATNTTGEMLTKTTAAQEDFKLVFNTDHLRGRVNDSGGTKTTTSAATDTGAFIIAELLVDGSNVSIFKNGASAATPTAAGVATDTALAQLAIGSFWPTPNAFMAGDIGEVILCNPVTGGPRSACLRYLGGKYAISIT